jgi:prepilin-type N-terminal cleavage/methylation domain-containing protein
MPTKQHQNGFSLIEILLAAALGLLLLACVLQIYLAIKATALTLNHNAKQQNNLRFITTYLQYHIGSAGYAGCGQIKYLDLKNHTEFPFAAANAIHGFNSNDSTLPIEFKKYKIKPNTDIVVIQKATLSTAAITAEIKKGAKSFYATANPATKFSDPLLLSDCISGDLIYGINSSGGHLVRSQNKIAHKYAVGATSVSRYTEVAYFISQNNLYYATNYGNKTMLADNVTAMQIRYGVDKKDSGKVDGHYSAADVTAQGEWEKVVSIIITLTQAAATASSKPLSWDIYIKLRERAL